MKLKVFVILWQVYTQRSWNSRSPSARDYKKEPDHGLSYFQLDKRLLRKMKYLYRVINLKPQKPIGNTLTILVFELESTSR